MTTQVNQTVKASASSVTLPSAGSPSPAVIHKLPPEDQVLLAKLLSEPTEYVALEAFAKPGMERELFDKKATKLEREGTRFPDPSPIMPEIVNGHRIPTLTHEQEQRLFMRYNFARRQVALILRSFAGKRLTPPATRRLLAWGHRVLDTRTAIVRLNLPLVLAMAKRTRLTSIDFNDLTSEGNMALLRSIEKFDCSLGYKFSTYACRAILKSFSRVAMRASRYRGRFPAAFDPSMERSDYLDTKRGIIEQDCVDELKRILINNLAELSDVERTVISERFAIGRPEINGPPTPKTLEQVGVIIGVTKERVRQIQNKALEKIRGALEEQYLAA